VALRSKVLTGFVGFGATPHKTCLQAVLWKVRKPFTKGRKVSDTHPSPFYSNQKQNPMQYHTGFFYIISM